MKDRCKTERNEKNYFAQIFECKHFGVIERLVEYFDVMMMCEMKLVCKSWNSVSFKDKNETQSKCTKKKRKRHKRKRKKEKNNNNVNSKDEEAEKNIDKNGKNQNNNKGGSVNKYNKKESKDNDNNIESESKRNKNEKEKQIKRKRKRQRKRPKNKQINGTNEENVKLHEGCNNNRQETKIKMKEHDIATKETRKKENCARKITAAKNDYATEKQAKSSKKKNKETKSKGKRKRKRKRKTKAKLENEKNMDKQNRECKNKQEKRKEMKENTTKNTQKRGVVKDNVIKKNESSKKKKGKKNNNTHLKNQKNNNVKDENKNRNKNEIAPQHIQRKEKEKIETRQAIATKKQNGDEFDVGSYDCGSLISGLSRRDDVNAIDVMCINLIEWMLSLETKLLNYSIKYSGVICEKFQRTQRVKALNKWIVKIRSQVFEYGGNGICSEEFQNEILNSLRYVYDSEAIVLYILSNVEKIVDSMAMQLKMQLIVPDIPAMPPLTAMTRACTTQVMTDGSQIQRITQSNAPPMICDNYNISPLLQINNNINGNNNNNNSGNYNGNRIGNGMNNDINNVDAYGNINGIGNVNDQIGIGSNDKNCI